MGGGLVVLAIVFFGLTLPLIVEGAPVGAGKLLGLIGFWVMGIILTLIPLAFKLEVGETYVRTYFFYFRILNLLPSNIEAMEYDNLFHGGLGVGKGLNIRINLNGKSKNTSIGENIYGKEAIMHAKRVLEQRGF